MTSRMIRADEDLIKTIKNIQLQFERANNTRISFTQATKVLAIINNRPINFTIEVRRSKRKRKEIDSLSLTL